MSEEILNPEADEKDTRHSYGPLNNDQEGRVQQAFYDHIPTPDQLNRDSQIRTYCRELMRTIMEVTPVSREQSLALTHLQEVGYWAYQAMMANEATLPPYSSDKPYNETIRDSRRD